MSGMIPPVIPPGLRQGINPMPMQIGQQGVNPPMPMGQARMNPPMQMDGGLLAPSGASYPTPMPPIPGLMPAGIRPVGLELGDSQILAFLRRAEEQEPDDSEEGLPGALKPYAAGLRPSVKPAEVEWQQEIAYERLGKTDQEITAIARHYFQSAEHYDNALSLERVTASQFYAGLPEGKLEDGRSKLVMTVVRDTIRQTLPSLLRLFTAVEDPVSFEPISNEIVGNDKLATQLARQATDYSRWALFTANKGWQVLHDCLLDALTRKAGWVRWYWGSRRSIRTEVCEGLLLPQLQLLLSEPGIEAQRIVRRPMTQDERQAVQKTPEGAMYLQQGPAELWSATITRTAAQPWPQIEHVAADCVWIVAEANTVENANAVWHVRDVTVSELIEAGLPADKIMAHRGAGQRMQGRREAIARSNAQGQNIRQTPPSDKSMALVRYAEGWIKCDADNDNRAELIHVHMLGNAQTLVQWERCDEIPLACFTPYREPGRVIGNSQADMVMDLQRVESRVMRAILDSLGQSMFPRTAVVVGQANMADVRQTAIGSIIRVAQQGAVQELVKPFSGKEALPVMQVLEAIRESRTGITRASSGLTVDELQSTTPAAISQQSSAAQDRLDMVARTLAETGLAPLYAGILKMLARQQDRPSVIRIRGEWVSIDPRALATMWETSVNVGGRGMPHERLAMLAQVAAKQEQIMMQGGLDNPLVGIPEYRNTLGRMLETVGVADVSNYFRALPPGWQPPPKQPQPTPEQLLAEVEKNKTAADVENRRAEQQTKRASLLLEDERERDKAALDAWSRTWVAAAQYGTPAPSLTEFQEAMKNQAPTVGLLADMPAPTSAEPPAVGAPPKPPQQPGPQRPMMGGPGPAMMPPRPPAPAQQPPISPVAAQAIQQGLQGRGLPTAYGQLAARASGLPLFGPGGPPLPQPAGVPGAA